jgi:sirohydrochlorin cobaltochelatase
MITAPKAAILLVAHRSSNIHSDPEFLGLLGQLRTTFPARPCTFGVLEPARATIYEGLTELVQQGAREITVLPGMLLATADIQNAILSTLQRFQVEYPDIKLIRGEALGVHAKLLQAARDKIEFCEPKFGPGYNRKHTLLLVAAEGTADPEANALVSKITRMLWEGMGFGWAETGYSEVTLPQVTDVLAQVQRLGFQQVVLFPCLLFNKNGLAKIHTAVATWQMANPQLKVVKTPPVGAHPLVLEAFAERIYEAENGTGNRNCQFCPYREQSVAPAPP